MIVLDTHIWVWWVHDDPQLLKEYKEYIERNEQSGIGISAITCWEVAKLVEYGRFVTMDGKIRQYPHVQLAP